MRPARLVFLVLVVVAVAGLLRPRPPAVAAAGDAADPGAKKAQWMGVATCAASGCHAGNLGREQKGSEYSTWAAHDKHAKAFQVLYGERSQRMVTNLCGEKAQPATKTDLCLKCHAMYGGKGDSKGERFWLGDGVGCESCHGPAEHYVAEHYRDSVQQLSQAEKARALARLGMWDTKDLVGRSEICAGCHVGNAEKEVNHDLIAAGHPRLNFEFSTFLAIYPRHWKRSAELARHPDFEARAWAVGQVASARSALALLGARAGDPKKPWPEFAEYHCYACHKDLSADLPLKKEGRRPGNLPWGTWYFAVMEPLARHSGVDLNEPGSSWNELRTRMETARADRAAVKKEAAALLGKLDEWSRLPFPTSKSDHLRDLAKSLAGRGVSGADALDWDQAIQLHLSLAAINQGLKDQGGAPAFTAGLTGELHQLRLGLTKAFRPGSDGPTLFGKDVQPGLRERFRAIQTQLGK